MIKKENSKSQFFLSLSKYSLNLKTFREKWWNIIKLIDERDKSHYLWRERNFTEAGNTLTKFQKEES